MNRKEALRILGLDDDATADDIKIAYKDLDLPDATGYRCPSCGLEFMDGEFVVNELNSAETMLEGK